ncbi:MAG: PhoX family phosphatase [Pseudomonadota bacterium]
MKDLTHDMDFDEFDEALSPKPETCDFDRVVESAISRRGMLSGVLAFGGVAMIGGALAPKAQAAAHAGPSRFAFDAIPTSTADAITVPSGYNVDIIVRWGDPITPDGPEFDHATLGTGASQAVTFGDNIDGMELFQVGDSTIIVVNNEYTNRSVLWSNRPDGKPASDDDILKGKMAHGLTIVEVDDAGGKWEVVKDSAFNRRVTPDTPAEITGPARGHDLVKTAADPEGVQSLGTWNNCGSGKTPWGTYLACEENFNGYFSSSDEGLEFSKELSRYGVRSADWGYGWAKIDERFDVAKHPNEANRAGYIVEVDPSDPTSTPKKRSALGRFKHENAEVVINVDGRVVIYMGDDERGEYLYRYISNGVYAPGVDTDDLMDNGTLYAAKFNDDGTGAWLALTPATTGLSSEAEICIHTRLGASAVNASTMDRPEWVSANPNAAEVYCCLTNNKNRGVKPNAGGDDTSVNGPNPREANLYGQIVRWRPAGGDHTAEGFDWDLFVMAGNPTIHSDANAGSSNVNEGNMFNSPDGLAFDSSGLLWIQTDGNYKNEGDFAGQGNNQMLAGDPVTGEIRRFMTGPKECEITGLCWSPDKKTMFVGIQHPGERGDSHWPEGGDATPRSAVVAVTRADGGLVG